MTPNPSFVKFDWKNGLLYDDSSAADFPIRVHALVADNTFHFNAGSSYFMYQYSGYSFINGKFPLTAGYYAVATEKEVFVSGNFGCQLLIIESIGHDAPFQIGGAIEDAGRLKYIDGCTDSLLIAPWKYGEPCLNHLHFPAGIDQTPHTHPSVRIGVVAKGNGECITPFGITPLTAGTLFAILPETGMQATGKDGRLHDEGTHSFRTFPDISTYVGSSHPITGGAMDVIAFHPDSDFGPRDEEHPMINRTIVNGVSAKIIDEIRTK